MAAAARLLRLWVRIPPGAYMFVSVGVCIRVCRLGFVSKDLQEIGGGRGDWMELAQDRDRWRALMGTVKDFRVS